MAQNDDPCMPSARSYGEAEYEHHMMNAKVFIVEVLDTLKAQRDELLAVLKDMVDLHEHEPDRPAVAHAREVIAKVEGR